MGNFNRNNNKFGGGGGSNFKKRNFGGGGGGNGFEKEMFRAVCAECGKDCEVPFRPNGRKPVLCSDCFQKDNGQQGGGGNDFRPDRGNDGNRFERNDRPNFNDRSSGGRPDFRNDRPDFRSKPSNGGNSGISKQDFDALNAKVDKILRLLSNNEPAFKPDVAAYEKAPKQEKLQYFANPKLERETPKVDPIDVIEAIIDEKPVAKKAAKAPKIAITEEKVVAEVKAPAKKKAAPKKAKKVAA